MTIDWPVTIDLGTVPLKTAMDWAIRPLKLADSTRDGLLIVSSRQEIGRIELRTLNEQLQRTTLRSEGSTEPSPHAGTSLASGQKPLKN